MPRAGISKESSCEHLKDLVHKNLSSALCTSEREKEEDAIRNLQNVVTRTAKYGESNSILIIGPQGSGKNRVLNIVLDKVRLNPDINNNLLRVHLNGLLQTDDRISLKEITRQLQMENMIDCKSRGFAENLHILLQSLKVGNRSSKSVLFILDEFDLFCHHKNQTLLYNLFDVAQSAQTPVCVVGLTCRMDVIEMLEKRVKSRFSHRQIHIFSRHSFDEYLQLAKDFLTVPPENSDAKIWNKSVQATFETQTVKDILRRYYNMTKNIRALKKLLYCSVSCCKNDDFSLRASHLINSMNLITLNSKSTVLTGLSVLELCLIIAMTSLTIKYEGEAFNLQMVYDEYIKFARSHSTIQKFEFPVITKAFEHLQALELVVPSTGLSNKGVSNYQLMTILIDRSQVREAVQSYAGLSTEIQQWAASALTY